MTRTAVSWSRFETFELCPRKFQLQSIVPKDAPHRIPYVQSAAGQRGEDAHKDMENVLLGNRPHIPLELQWLVPRLTETMSDIKRKELPFWIEYAMTLDQRWTPTGKWDNDVWMRGRVDFGFIEDHTLVLLDWKTGKYKPKPTDQLGLYACCLMSDQRATMDAWRVDCVQTNFIWLDHPKKPPTGRSYTIPELAELREKFWQKSELIEEAVATNEYPERENWLCAKYCGACVDACSVKRRVGT